VSEVDSQEIVAKGSAIVARFKDRATYEDMDELVALFDQLTPVIVAACHDDSEQCTYCAWPEYGLVVLAIGDTHMCREHVERGLTAATGATFDRS
jgi:hypothetical protein